MSTFVKRSGRDRRESINDLEYFARGGDERRTHGAERRAYERTSDFPERNPEPPIYRNQQSVGIINHGLKYAVAVLVLVTAYVVWKMVSG